MFTTASKGEKNQPPNIVSKGSIRTPKEVSEGFEKLPEPLNLTFRELEDTEGLLNRAPANMAKTFDDTPGHEAHISPLQLTFGEAYKGGRDKDVQVITTHELKEISLKDQVDVDANARGDSLKPFGGGEGLNSSIR